MQKIQSLIPRHIAIVMDGNRRWAKDKGLPVLEGHRRVTTDILEPLIERAADMGIDYMTLWAWSTENWKRAQEEVGGIMKLLRWGFDSYGARMHKKGMRIKVIGDISKLDEDIQLSLQNLIELTKNNTRITVVFALNYGGRDEIMRAIGKAGGSPVTKENFSDFLDTAGIPDPDMIIRPGGEKRLSGFLLWQSQYAELYFADWYMPDFTPEKLDEIVEEFSHRKRRFGK